MSRYNISGLPAEADHSLFEVIALSMDPADPWTKQATSIAYEQVFPDSPICDGLGDHFMGIIHKGSGEVVAMAGGFFEPDIDGQAFLQVLAVAEKYQSLGLGKLLLHEVEQAACEEFGAESLGLEPTPESADFYSRLGYTTCLMNEGLVVKRLTENYWDS